MTRFIILSALALSGCIHHRSGMPISSVIDDAGWTKGVTTQRDVVEKWGNPHRTSGNTWIWREWISNGGKIKASYYMIGITVSNAAVSFRDHRLEFDHDGTLAEWETSESVSDGAQWSIWPW